MKARNRVALPTALSLVALLIVVACFNLGADSAPAASPGVAADQSPSSNGAISPQAMADSLHFVIAADREMYCRTFIAQQNGNAPSSNTAASGKQEEPWPLPAEMFRRASESIQSKGAEFSYALRSLTPIDPRNGPQTELEKIGLAFVASHPSENYYGAEMLGGRRYVTAVYPDLPAAAACIECHNRRAGSAARRHQPGEILGGVVVRVPLEF